MLVLIGMPRMHRLIKCQQNKALRIILPGIMSIRLYKACINKPSIAKLWIEITVPI